MNQMFGRIGALNQAKHMGTSVMHLAQVAERPHPSPPPSRGGSRGPSGLI